MQPGRILIIVGLALLGMLSVACGGPGGGADGDNLKVITLQSEAFDSGGEIPADYSCEGRDHSPPLTWGSRPDGAQALALIMDDLDADGFVHWVVYNLDPSLSGLARVGQTETLPGGGGDQGRNSFGGRGYRGPCPPEGEFHTYRFRLFVLDSSLELKPGASANELTEAMEGHIIAEGQLTGEFGR